MSPVRAFATIFMAVFLFIFLGSALVTFLMPQTFVAAARVRVDGGSGAKFFQSSELLLSVSKELNLPATYAARYGQTEPLKEDRVLNLLRRSVQIRTLRDPNLVEIRVYGVSPSECVELANAMAKVGTAQLAAAPANARIIDLAVIPSKPARPNVPLNLTLGAIVGAFLGIMAGGVGAKLAVGFDGKGKGGTTGPAEGAQ